MTSTEAFEVWWKEYDGQPLVTSQTVGRNAWLSACTWQRERDIKAAEAHLIICGELCKSTCGGSYLCAVSIIADISDDAK